MGHYSLNISSINVTSLLPYTTFIEHSIPEKTTNIPIYYTNYRQKQGMGGCENTVIYLLRKRLYERYRRKVAQISYNP